MEIELKEGWTKKKLGDISNITSSKRIFQEDYVNKGVPFFRTKEIKELSEGKEISIELFITEQKYNDIKSRFEIPKIGDILISAVGTIGVSYIIKNSKPFYFKDGNLVWVKDLTGIDSAFLNYYLMHFVRFKQNIATSGSAYNALTIIKLKDFDILLPPPEEQRQIVEKIEELFSEMDKGIENLKTAQQQLKVYRQAVLKWAFVNDTFKEYIAKDITEKIQIGPFGTQLHKEDYIENGIPLINPTHIKDGLIVADKSFTILESKRESLPNYILKEGDVIMGRRGEMARCGLVSKKEAGWFCGTGSLYFRPNLKLVDPVFLYHNLKSQSVKKYLEENAGGTTMANLNLKIVNNIPISIPSIKEQKAIVLEIESRLSVCDKMEETINTSLQQAEALRQSILKRAFEGKLVKPN